MRVRSGNTCPCGEAIFSPETQCNLESKIYIIVFYCSSNIEYSKKYAFHSMKQANWFIHNEGDHVVVAEIQKGKFEPVTDEEKSEYEVINEHF